MTVTTANARHVLFRLAGPARLPEALLGTLRDEVVLAGWMRASGVLHDVVLRGASGSSVRSLSGAVHVIALEGSIGLSQGDVTCGLRAVLARETDTGLETLAGEIIEARVDALEVLVTAFDDVSATRQGGVWSLDASSQPAPAPAPKVAEPPVRTAAPAPTPIAPAVPPPASSEPETPRAAPPKPSPTFSTATAMPRPVAKPKAEEEEEMPYPDAGDVVEHFAFGRCEVVKSDGDRLHLRLGKDGRVKEIALEMLKVTPLPPLEGAAEGASGKHFRLDRKL